MGERRIHPKTNYPFNQERLEQLKRLLPEAFFDGQIRWDVLQDLLSHPADDETQSEYFGLNWSGKQKARQLLSQPSKGTLIPVKGAGVHEDTTRHIFIEADNLEALKLLQKSYAGRVKMIYIDPPYNTGNDFIYNDDFTDSLADYLQQTGQMDENKQMLVTNPKTNGRFHSRWLSMMYPRLILARTLLREDGVIFVSIDDNEVHHLRMLMDEVFGEENFIINLYIQVRYPDKTLVEDADFHKLIEQVLVFGKSDLSTLNKENGLYTLDKFIWEVNELSEPSQILEMDGKRVEIFEDSSYQIQKRQPSTNLLKEVWATGSVLEKNSSGRFFRDYISGRYREDGYGVLYKVFGIGDDQFPYRYFTGPKKYPYTKGKYYQGVPNNRLDNLDTSEKTTPIYNFYNFADNFGNCRHEGNIDFRNGKKPIDFLKMLIQLATSPEDSDIVVDFFAGSGSIGHAVYEQNYEDEIGNRQFILIQLPEIPKKEVPFDKISDLTIERLKRSISQVQSAKPNQGRLFNDIDLGFKVFRYASSHYREWETVETEEEYMEQLELWAESSLKDGWLPENVVYEVALLEGYTLNMTITPVDHIHDVTVYRVYDDLLDQSFHICLDKTLPDDLIDRLGIKPTDLFICLDSALDDTRAANFALYSRLKTL